MKKKSTTFTLSGWLNELIDSETQFEPKKNSLSDLEQILKEKDQKQTK